MEGAQGEPDREVVDAQRYSGEQQPPGPLSARRGGVLVPAVAGAPSCFAAGKALPAGDARFLIGDAPDVVVYQTIDRPG